MKIKEAIELVIKRIADYLEKRFTGQITITFHCKDGGIGRVSLDVKQNFSRKDLTTNQP